MRRAVIDIGTNSVKFCVGEKGDDGRWQELVERAEVTRLGEGLADTGALADEAVARTAAAIEAMVAEARERDADEVIAVATAGMRMASNPESLIDAVRERSGVEIRVISGDEEARLAYVAVVAALPEVSGSLVVFETGGGSSQFTFGHGTHVDERFSLNVGAARYTERFGLDKAVELLAADKARAAAAEDLREVAGRAVPDVAVGMGGAVTNMAAVSQELAEYDPAAVQGAVLTRDEIERQIELYAARSADERRAIPGLQPGRAEVILAGACIVVTVLDLIGVDALRVSDRGLRHGLLVEG